MDYIKGCFLRALNVYFSVANVISLKISTSKCEHRLLNIEPALKTYCFAWYCVCDSYTLGSSVWITVS